MITVEQIDTAAKAQVGRFIRLPFRLYREDRRWVPPLWIDMEMALNRRRHPFYEHSDADFFIATRNGEDVGRIAAIENRRFNQFHGTRKAQFFFFESEDDQAVADALFGRLFEWAHARGLDVVLGPKGLGPLDGYGLLVDGFEQRQMMTMMNYNPPSYPRMVEALGFSKEVDFLSCYTTREGFRFPERIHKIAQQVERRGVLRVQRFASKRELRAWAGRIGHAYNNAFVHNWEYYPLTDREIAFILQTLETIADPRLIKVIVHEQEVVGFLFAFPDVAPALQRHRGRLLPFGLIDMLIELRRTPWVAVNSAGVLPEFHGRGGNALLYTELEKTLHSYNFQYGVLYQVAETAVQMRRDLQNLGGIAYKNHRVFTRKV